MERDADPFVLWQQQRQIVEDLKRIARETGCVVLLEQAPSPVMPGTTTTRVGLVIRRCGHVHDEGASEMCACGHVHEADQSDCSECECSGWSCPGYGKPVCLDDFSLIIPVRRTP